MKHLAAILAHLSRGESSLPQWVNDTPHRIKRRCLYLIATDIPLSVEEEGAGELEAALTLHRFGKRKIPPPCKMSDQFEVDLQRCYPIEPV